jgi:sugar (pentulose or hexulose) kinase
MRSERPSAYIGIDLGSSACKLIAIDQDSHIIISQRIIIEDNATEQNPEHQWQTVLKGLEQLIPHCSDYQLKAICVDARLVR